MDVVTHLNRMRSMKNKGNDHDDDDILYGGSLFGSILKSASKAAGKTGKSIAKVGAKRIGKVTKKGGKLLRRRGGKIIKQQKRHLIRKGVKLAKKTEHRLTKTINQKAAQSSIKNIFNTTQLPSKSRRTRKTIGKRG